MREVVPEDESRVWDNPGYKPKVEYDEMRSQFFECWACHATRKPREYYGPWMLERAHVCNKPRKEDRRAVIMLCTICHKASHGEIVVGFEVPKLSVSEMIVLKRERDPEWFDLPFLQKCSIRKLHIADPFPRLSEEFYALRERNKLKC